MTRRRAGQLSRATLGALLTATAAAMALAALVDVSFTALLVGWTVSLLAAGLAWVVGLQAPPLKEEHQTRLERASVRLPMIGVSVVMPLTLHAAVAFYKIYAARSWQIPWEHPSLLNDIHLTDQSFSGWVLTSVMFAGLAHAVLAWLAARDADRQLTPGEQPPIGWRAALGWTVAVSCVPGIVFGGLPPIIALVTGLAFIPAMFAASTSVCRWERAADQWDALRARLRLEAGRQRRFFPSLHGTAHQMPITLSARRAPRAMWVTLEVQLSGCPDLALRARRTGQRGGHHFGDPIADGVLLVESDPEVVQRLLSEEQTYGLLMEVVSGLGAVVSGGTLTLSLKREDLDDIEHVVEKAATVAALLEGRPSATPSPLQQARHLQNRPTTG